MVEPAEYRSERGGGRLCVSVGESVDPRLTECSHVDELRTLYKSVEFPNETRPGLIDPGSSLWVQIV